MEELDRASEAQRLAMEDPITAGIVKLNQRSRYTGKSTTSTKKQKKDTDDPFSRRKTSATIATIVPRRAQEEEKKEEVKVEEKPVNLKDSMDIDADNPLLISIAKEHNFDINIDIDKLGFYFYF